MATNVSIYLDKRSRRKNGEHPFKLRIYDSVQQKAKYYGIGISASEKVYNALIDPKIKVRGENRELKILVNSIEMRAVNVANNLSNFTFEEFERKFFRSSAASFNLEYHYSNKIAVLKQNGQFSTASSYELSFRSIANFIHSTKGQKTILIQLLTPKLLKEYESYMIDKLHKSPTTVGIYLRSLRSILNTAIANKDIPQDFYPFGVNKYQIPRSLGRKSALSELELSRLFKVMPRTKEQQIAKDFWFLSYACSGMNMKDIALLKVRDIENGVIRYTRSKTARTKRSNQGQISVFMNNYVENIIKKYSFNSYDPNSYVFNIVGTSDGGEERQRKIKNFTRFVNQHVKHLARQAGISNKISFQWARHSYATNAIRKGKSMEFVSEALNHSNLIVTKNYFAGFDDTSKKEFAMNLMEFSKVEKSNSPNVLA